MNRRRDSYTAAVILIALALALFFSVVAVTMAQNERGVRDLERRYTTTTR